MSQTLSPEDVNSVASDPLLSSGRVLDGIFYKSTIITESDADTVIYEPLTTKEDPTGETYYVNSYSKQATTSVSAPYRKMGVPHAAIIDLDLIRVGPEFLKVAEAFLDDPIEASELAISIRTFVEKMPASDLVASAINRLRELPQQMADLNLDGPSKELEWLRARLAEIRAEASAWSKLKKNGVHSGSLEPEEKAKLERLIQICAQAGLFLVPVGERESWLEPDVPYSKNKAAYTKRAVEYLSKNELAETAPLKTFLSDVNKYLSNY